MPWGLSRDEIDRLPRPVVALARDYPAGHEIEAHRHRRAQLIYAASGVMTVFAAGAAWVVPPQRGLWMPADEEHRITCHGPLAMRTIYLDSAAVAPMAAAVRVVGISALLRELILRAVALPALYDLQGPHARLVAVIQDEMAELPQAPLGLPMPHSRRLQALARELLQDPAAPAPIPAMAARAHMSSRTFMRRFRAETGLSFGAWRQQARLLRALVVLGQGGNVTEAALDVGYEAPSAFIAMFRRALGLTPGRYLETFTSR